MMISISNLQFNWSAKGRKFLAILFFSLGAFISVSAQTNPEKWTGGIVAGGNVSQVDGDGYRGYNKINPVLGGVLFMPVPSVTFGEGMLAWSLEVLYHQKGAYGKGAGMGGTLLSQDIRLTYAEVPIQLNYWRGPIKSSYAAGLGFAYLGSSEEKITTVNGQNYNFPFRRADVSFMMSANFHLGSGFFISPRFQYSLLSIRKKNQDLTAFGRVDQFNNVFGIRLMYVFNTK